MKTAPKGMTNAPPPMTGNRPQGVRGQIRTGSSRATTPTGAGKRSNNMVAGNASRKR